MRKTKKKTKAKVANLLACGTKEERKGASKAMNARKKRKRKST